MLENSVDDKLFDAILKIASEEAMRQDIETMLSCREANEQYKPSPALDKKIRKIISRHNFIERTSSLKKTALKCAACFAIFTVVSSTLLLSVEATRNFIFNAVVKWQEDHFSIEHGNSSIKKLTIYKPTHLPDGFEEISSNVMGDINRIIYQDKTGIEILLTQYSSSTSNILSDFEDKDFTTIKINQQNAYLVDADEKNKNNTIIWEYNGVIFHIDSELESAELISIAESIKK